MQKQFKKPAIKYLLIENSKSYSHDIGNLKGLGKLNFMEECNSLFLC